MKTKLKYSLFGDWEDRKQDGEWSLDFCNRVSLNTTNPDKIKQVLQDLEGSLSTRDIKKLGASFAPLTPGSPLLLTCKINIVV
jgi:hypothetical protein